MGWEKSDLLREVSQMELLARGPEVQSGKLEAARAVPPRRMTGVTRRRTFGDCAMVVMMRRRQRAGRCSGPAKIQMLLDGEVSHCLTHTYTFFP